MFYNRLLGLVFLSLSFSCIDKVRDFDYLVYKGEHILQLDSLTSNSISNHYQIYEKENQPYLFILTPYNNRIVYYDFRKQEKVGQIIMENDFGNFIAGGAPPSGFYIYNMDSIFLYDYRRNSLYLGNEKAELKKVFEFMKEFPSDRSYWGGIFQESKPYFINDSLLSIGGSVQWGNQAIVENQNVDIVLNLNSKIATRETQLPSCYLVNNYYPSTRLRPSRALDENNRKVYYSYYNSDSIFVRDLRSNTWSSFYAGFDGMLPYRNIDNVTEFDNVENGSENQMIYNVSQGGHFNVFYDSYHEVIIRVGFLGIENFNYLKHNEKPYDFNLFLTFYDGKSLKKLGSFQVERFDYRFIVFDENSIFVTRPNLSKTDDELTFYEYEYPDF